MKIFIATTFLLRPDASTAIESGCCQHDHDQDSTDLLIGAMRAPILLYMMAPKIGFGGVAYHWIESFSKVFMLLRVAQQI